MDKGDTISVTNENNEKKILTITSKSFNTEGGPEMSAYDIFYVGNENNTIQGILTPTDNNQYNLSYQTKGWFFWSHVIKEKIINVSIVSRNGKGYTRKRKQNKKRKSRR